MTQKIRSLTAAALLVLTGCSSGSSSGGGSPPPATPPTASIAGSSVAEGDTGTKVLQLSVSLSASTGSSVTINYATEDGTATAGQDYESASGTVTIAAGATAASISLTILGDTVVEPDEQFGVRLSAPANAQLGTALATVTIVNDDAAAAQFGLDARPQNLTCVAPARALTSTGIDVVDAFPNLPSTSTPTKILLEPGANPRWFVLEKGGRVRVFDAMLANSLTTFLDLSSVVRTSS
ncbi:MAG: Calx-beta domain-containing protein, partial [Woeseia sp.]